MSYEKHNFQSGDKLYASQLNEMDEQIFELSPKNLWVNSSAVDTSKNGIVYTFSPDKSIVTVKGTASAASFCNLIIGLPSWMKAGYIYKINIDSTDINIQIGFYFFNSVGTNIALRKINGTSVIDVPTDATNVTIRIDVNNSATVDGTISVSFYDAKSNKELTDITDDFGRNIYAKNSLLHLHTDNSVVLSEFLEDGFYKLESTWNVIDAPSGVSIGVLTVENFAIDRNGFIKQIAESITDPSICYVRFSNASGVFGEWKELSKKIIVEATNNYSYPNYSNTYNLTVNPTITQGSNGFLQAENRDMTADIQAMLATGICRLGEGTFKISGINMPQYSMLIGSGTKTVILLNTNVSDDGYAIKMNNYCIVKDLMIYGQMSDITLTETPTNRHGILWQGNYQESQSVAQSPWRGTISGVYICRFTGGAITLYNTGYAAYNCLNVSDCFIWNCNVGVNIAYWSEFNRFTNIIADHCWYGCINNGGNNVFVNCDFSNDKVGMLMDNSSNQSPNNTHGSAVGCVFNHSDNNTGYGVRILNCANGFIFEGCQLFFSKIGIDNSEGVVFTGTNFGSTNAIIEVNGGGAVLFTNNMHQANPTINITDNTKVHFANCYNRTTGAVISN